MYCTAAGLLLHLQVLTTCTHKYHVTLTLEWLPWRASWQNGDYTLPPVVVGAAAAKRHQYITK